MSWKKVANKEPSFNSTSVTQKHKGTGRIYRYRINNKILELTKKEVWDILINNVTQKAPLFTPLIYLPCEDTKSSKPITFDGEKFFVNEKFYKMPIPNMLYLVYYELVQVTLGFRTEKNIEITNASKQMDEFLLRLRRNIIKMQIGRVEDVVTHCILLGNAEMVGISQDSIKPTESLKTGIYKLFGRTGMEKNSESYIDNFSKLQRFISTWSKYNVNNCYETVASGDKSSFDNRRGNYKSDILYHISSDRYQGRYSSGRNGTPIVIDIPTKKIEEYRYNMLQQDNKIKRESYENMLKEYLKESEKKNLKPREDSSERETNSSTPNECADMSENGDEFTDDTDSQTEVNDNNVKAISFSGNNSDIAEDQEDSSDIQLTDEMIDEMCAHIDEYPEDIRDLLVKAALPSEGNFLKEYIENNNIDVEDKEFLDDILDDAEYEVTSEIVAEMKEEDALEYERQKEERVERSDAAKREIEKIMRNEQMQYEQEMTWENDYSNKHTGSKSNTRQNEYNSGSGGNANGSEGSEGSGPTFDGSSLSQDQVLDFLDDVGNINPDAVDQAFDQISNNEGVFDNKELSNLINKALQDDTNLSKELKDAVMEALDSNDDLKEQCLENQNTEDSQITDANSDTDVFGEMEKSLFEADTTMNSEITDKTYHDVMISIDQFIKNAPGFSEDNTAPRLQPMFNNLYSVPNVWWKKAQKMIMGYVPDINSSYRRPNKKYVTLGYILPSKCDASEDSEVDRLRVFLDSSGSMSDSDFLIFKSIIRSSQKFFPVDTEAFEFNTEIKKMKCVKGKIIGEPQSTGGTNILCVTKHINSQPYKSKTLNIVVTDGGFSWSRLVNYMKTTDKQSRFLFILTRGNLDEAIAAKKDINPKRLTVISINSVDNDIKALKWG